jgi:hypothetical protein
MSVVTVAFRPRKHPTVADECGRDERRLTRDGREAPRRTGGVIRETIRVEFARIECPDERDRIGRFTHIGLRAAIARCITVTAPNAREAARDRRDGR